MAWSTPSTPVSGTVITVAWAVSSVVDPTNHLRVMTGGADPPAANRVVVSTSTSATSWQQVPGAAILAATITDANMALPHVHALNPLITTFALSNTGSGMFDIAPATDEPVAEAAWHLIQSQNRTGANYRWQLAAAIADPVDMYTRLVVAGTPGTWQKLWHGGNDGAGSGLDADLLDGQSSAFYATATAVAALVTFPLQGVCFFETLAQLTAAGANFARYTAGDGRLLVGAGTTFSQTFVEATNYGANWTPAVGIGAVPAHTGGDHFVVPSGAFGDVTTVVHGHPAPAGTTTAWLPPMRGGVWGRRTS